MSTAGTTTPSTAGTVGAAGKASMVGSIPLAGKPSSGAAGRSMTTEPTTLPSAGGAGAPSAAAGSSASGAAGMVNAAAGQAAPPAAGGGSLPMVTGPGPTLPEIKGDCPEFKDGTTIMVAGHKGVAITAGQPGKGGPLLFYWHGTGGNAQEAQRTLPAAVRNEIVSSGGIIAAFNGNQSSGAAGDCSGTGAHNIADFDAADQIAACAVKNFGIDPHRIYTTGCSAGGLQSGCMAQMRSSYLATAAPNSGGVVSNKMWQDKHSPAILTMHGGPNDKVIVTFSETSATLDMSSKAHGSFVVNCNHGGGHCQAPAALQTTAWQFAKDHPWGFDKSPWIAAFPSGTPDYCMIY
jgi:predicted esterase